MKTGLEKKYLGLSKKSFPSSILYLGFSSANFFLSSDDISLRIRVGCAASHLIRGYFLIVSESVTAADLHSNGLL